MSDSEENVRSQFIAAFGHDDIYQILGVAKSATSAEIKKGYMKMALVYHPDKGGEKEKFQALSLAHSILSDKEKRKLYDEDGTLNDSGDFNQENFDFWYQYFRNLFPQISLDDISRFEKEYIGSEEERRDVLAAYEQHKGHLRHIMDCIMFAEEGHEQRIIGILDSAISRGDIDRTKVYMRERARVLEEMQDEKKQEKKKLKQAKAAESSEQALTALIRARQQSRYRQESALASILSKYGDDEDEDNKTNLSPRRKKAKKSASYEVDEEEYQRIQRGLANSSKSDQKRKSQQK